MTDNDPSNSLFQRHWWLDAVCPGDWAETTVMRKGELSARLPYRLKRVAGLTAVTMPSLTQTLGPWLKPPTETKMSGQLTHQKTLMTELIDQLPAFDFFNQNFHHSITNWLPFYWKGFRQTTRYTYRLDDLSDLDTIWAGMGKGCRQEIRKAEKQHIMVENSDDVEQFLDLNDGTFSRQGLRRPYDRSLVRRIDAACADRMCRRILLARDADGLYHAGLYLVWDADSAYYLMAGSDPALRSSGAGNLLVWEAIRFSASVTKAFDFEGSMVEPIESFFRSFGPRQVPYFNVTKRNRRYALVQAGRDTLARVKR